MPASIAPIFCQFEWSNILSWDMLVVVLTFLFLDMFDTLGTVIGVSVKANMMDKEGRVDGLSRILMTDAISYVIINACTGKMSKTNAVLWVLAILFVLRYIFL